MKKLTAWVIVAAILILSGYDIYAATEAGGTITAVIRRAAFDNPTIPFAFGYLMAHFFGVGKGALKKD